MSGGIDTGYGDHIGDGNEMVSAPDEALCAIGAKVITALAASFVPGMSSVKALASGEENT